MARRRETEFEGRRQRIIDGALHVFAEKGYEEATNKEIAAAAGINSPGLIYHYFKDKEDLFRQVVEKRIPLMQLLSHPDELEGDSPRQLLTKIGEAYLRILEDRDAVNAFRLIIGEAARRPHVAQIFNELGPNRIFGFLAEYFQKLMDSGIFRKADPAMAARFFFSPFIVFVLTREVFRQPQAQSIDPASFLNENVDHFLRAMEPK